MFLFFSLNAFLEVGLRMSFCCLLPFCVSTNPFHYFFLWHQLRLLLGWKVSSCACCNLFQSPCHLSPSTSCPWDTSSWSRLLGALAAGSWTAGSKLQSGLLHYFQLQITLEEFRLHYLVPNITFLHSHQCLCQRDVV